MCRYKKVKIYMKPAKVKIYLYVFLYLGGGYESAKQDMVAGSPGFPVPSICLSIPWGRI